MIEKTTSAITSFDLWLAIAGIHHYAFLVRKRELSPYHIAPGQLKILQTIYDLGSRVTLSDIAKEVERKLDVISRQTAIMEKDGLITRIRDTPKSRILKIELTEKGLDLLNIGEKSKSLDEIWSFVTQEECQQVNTVLNRMLTELKKHIRCLKSELL
jgi:DNA-binding MarR family transcriptional regulator